MKRADWVDVSRLLLVAVACGTLATTNTSAQTVATPPSPETILVPDVYSKPDEKVMKESNKFFFFYRTNTSFEQAFTDLHFCTQFTRATDPLLLPAFVPWGEKGQRPVREPGPNPYGLVGELIVELLKSDVAGEYINKMRRCMEPRGYIRYPMTETSWKEVHPKNGEQQSLFMQAKLASGKEPELPEARQ
jgi:hypothetical protein